MDTQGNVSWGQYGTWSFSSLISILICTCECFRFALQGFEILLLASVLLIEDK